MPGGLIALEAPRTRVPPVGRALVVGLLVLDTVSDWVSDVLLSLLMPHHPLLLIGISHRSQSLLLASPRLPGPAYFLVGGLRQLAPAALYFLLGRWYGAAAVDWIESRWATAGRVARTVERWFQVVPRVVVAVAPVSLVCVLAGAASMDVLGFAGAAIIGIGLRLAIVRAGGTLLSTPLVWVADWIGSHRVAMASFALAVTVALLAWRWRKRQLPRAAEVLEIADASPPPAVDRSQG
jgi:membrane protein DedA with SNARE-associated domain